MLASCLNPRPIRNLVALAIVSMMLCGGWLFLPESHSQAPASTTANAALAPVLARLKVQQDLMTDNQNKIEAQTATLKEELRQAKIYAARSGAGRR